jgi:N6-L-threonylcarbamoyladenine synthase
MGKKLDVEVFYPRQEFCTDNGAMIALAGHLRLTKGQVSIGGEIIVKPRWSLEELEAV